MIRKNLIFVKNQEKLRNHFCNHAEDNNSSFPNVDKKSQNFNKLWSYKMLFQK